MIFYPAIDLKDGQCVRLLRGEMDQATVFSGDPAGQAGKFADAGCAWLHVVDLNGAFAGTPVNAPAVEAILAEVAIPIQLGGGIRDMETVAMWLEKGVRRVILGTAALKNPDLVKLAESFGAEGVRVSTPGALRSELVKAVENDRVTVIDVPVALSWPVWKGQEAVVATGGDSQ